ncbi:MAG: 4-hydroxy-tetrahydrodipicolinate synthase [Phycisphaerales bacterium]
MSKKSSFAFRGAYTAIITPFAGDGSALDFGRLKEQIEFQAAGGVAGIVVAGTTGESPTLSEAEYRELLRRSIEVARPLGLAVIAGTGSNSTHHAIELQRQAAAAGADAALSVNPYYNKPTQEGLYQHFVAQAEAADLPVMLYNIPGRSGVALHPDTIVRLAEHPNIVSVKEATGSVDSCAEIAARCPKLAVLSGDDGLTIAFAAVGAVGVVSVLSNVVPQRVAALCKSCNEGDFGAALRVHRELMPLTRAMFLETNPIPVKAAMKLLGRDSGIMRLPMTPARPETLRALEKALGGTGVAPGSGAGAPTMAARGIG